MTTRRLMLCAVMALGGGLYLASGSWSQEMDGFAGLRGPEMGGPRFPTPGGPQGSAGHPGPGGEMRGGPMHPGGFPGPGFAGGGFPPGGPMDGRFPDPEIRERLERSMRLRHKVVEATHKYREADAKEKDEAKAGLKRALGDLFDVELANREHRAETLGKEAARMKDILTNAKRSRDKLIGQKLEQLTDEGAWEW